MRTTDSNICGDGEGRRPGILKKRQREGMEVVEICTGVRLGPV
jgi:hypothetical protein